jgi:hypothetical protein
MSVVNPNVRFSYEDYQSLPESMEKRYDLLDGDLMMVPALTTLHQRASRNLVFLLIQFVRARNLGEVFDAPVDLVLGKNKNREVVQFDLTFVSHARKEIVTKKEVRSAPDLIRRDIIARHERARSRLQESAVRALWCSRVLHRRSGGPSHRSLCAAGAGFSTSGVLSVIRRADVQTTTCARARRGEFQAQ